MTVTLNLPPDVEQAYLAEAQAKGVALDTLIRDLVLTHTPSKGAASKRPAGRKSLAQLFAESPLKGLDLKFERDPDTGRPVEL